MIWNTPHAWPVLQWSENFLHSLLIIISYRFDYVYENFTNFYQNLNEPLWCIQVPFTFQLLWWVPGARLCEIREYLPTDCDVRRGTYPRILSFHGTSAPTTRSPNLSTERWKCLIVFTICPQRVWFHFSINGLNVAYISRVKLSHKGTNDQITECEKRNCKEHQPVKWLII